MLLAIDRSAVHNIRNAFEGQEHNCVAILNGVSHVNQNASLRSGTSPALLQLTIADQSMCSRIQDIITRHGQYTITPASHRMMESKHHNALLVIRPTSEVRYGKTATASS